MGNIQNYVVFFNFGINVPMYAIHEATQKRHLSRRPGPLAQLGVVPAPGVVGVDPRGHNVVQPELAVNWTLPNFTV